LGASGWSRVLGIDAVGGPPHCDFADEGGARVTPLWCPDWRGITLAGVILDLAGEVGDELGSLGQVVAPDGMVLRRGWNAREPGQRTWVGRRELWEAPVKDGGHVAGSAEVASGGGCQHVAERVFTGFGRQREQVGSQGWPGGCGNESGEVLVGLVELCDGLGSHELFGCGMEAIGIALDRLEKLGRWVVELAQQGAGGDGRFIAGEDLLQSLGRRGWGDRLGSDEAVGVAVADDLEVEVVGLPAAGQHGVQLWSRFLPGQQAVHGVGGDALGAVNGGGVAESGRCRDVIRGELALELAAAVPDSEPTAGVDVGDGPPVAVLDPVGGRESEARSLERVMIMSPTLARLPSPRRTSCPAGAPARR
jgi:hypothetical protein